MKHHTIQVRSILAAFASREEYVSLRLLLGADWEVGFAPTFPTAEAVLQASSFGVVICAAYFSDGHCWKDIMREIQRLPLPPQLIVADRLADEALWAEVLNLGCYDLLTTPFEPKEVLRVLPMAWDFWKRELEQAAAHPKPTEPCGSLSARSRSAAPVRWKPSKCQPGARADPNNLRKKAVRLDS